MRNIVPQTVFRSQPLAVRALCNDPRMSALNPFPYLWDNIRTLMGVDAPSIDSVQKRVKIGRGTVQRIKDGDTNVRAQSLKVIAEAFHLEAWQLLVPGLDAKNPPQLGEVKVLTASVLSSDLTAAIANLDEAGRMRVENVIRAHLELPLGKEISRPEPAHAMGGA